MNTLDKIKGLIVNKIQESGDELYFYTSCGKIFYMYHSQSCCENVYIDQIDGDLSDLLNNELLLAEEVSNEITQNNTAEEEWTFYKFATIKGYVTIKWLGTSNGYYSTSVSFEEIL